ncbi:hypothetical protein BDN72DRAFT_778433, partial [Pluteus cervinus]
FFQVFITLAALSVSTSVLALTDAEIIAARRGSGADIVTPVLFLRPGCDYSTPCAGNGWAPGLHCGDGLLGCKKGNVYQVGSDTNVCDFGKRNSCVECNDLSCP